MNKEDLRKRIGRRLNQVRTAQGLTQKSIANLVEIMTGRKITPDSLSKLERGKQYPSILMLKRLGDALSVKVDYFLSENGKAERIARTKEELNLLRNFRKLNPQEKKVVEQLIKRLGEKK